METSDYALLGLIIGLLITVVIKSIYMPKAMWIQSLKFFGRPYSYIENVESKKFRGGIKSDGSQVWDLVEDKDGSKGLNLHFFLWPLFTLHKFKISYTRKIKNGEQKDGDIILKKITDPETKEILELLILRTRETDHLLFRKNYPMLTTSLSTKELANINVLTDPVIEIINPEKALYGISDWLQTSISILSAALRGFISKENLYDLNKISSEGGSAVFNDDIKHIVNLEDDSHPGLFNIGVKLFKNVFEDYDPADEESKKLMDSYSKVTIIKQEATALIEKTKGEAISKERIADANAYITNTEKKAEIEMEKRRLVDTGHAKTDKKGNIVKLVPDANVKAGTDALSKLSKLKGTLVLDSDTTKVLNLNK